MKEIFFTTEDNVRIAANYYENGFDGVVIVIHGWYMTKDSRAFREISESFAKRFDVITIDCRGHGRSSGFYTFTAKEMNDIDVAVSFAKEHYKKIYLCGFSLGGALAVLYSVLKGGVDRIIAVSAPCDFDRIENYMWHPNAWIPTLKKFEPVRWVSIRPSLIMHKKIKPLDVVGNLKSPALFIAGGRDVTVKSWHTEKLYLNAGCEKRYELFENCIHAEDIFLEEQNRFINTCFEWLASSEK